MNLTVRTQQLNNEQANHYWHNPRPLCTYPGCTLSYDRIIWWCSTAADPDMHVALSCAGHEVYCSNLGHVVRVEVQR